MATSLALNSMNDTTAHIIIAMDADEANLSVPARTLSCEPEMLTPSLFGENSLMIAGKPASIAPPSETKADTYRLSLSDRLMQSLITLGLVRGITHTSIRKRSGAAIRASALWPLDGGNAE